MTNHETKIGVSASTLAAWMKDELASWEDHERKGAADGHVRYSDGTLHVREVLGRRRTQVVWRSRAELHRLWSSADHHARYRGDRYAYRAALGRIALRLHAIYYEGI